MPKPADPNSSDASPGENAANRTPGVRQTFRALRSTIVELWWRFFNWLAIVPWTTFAIVFSLGLILAGLAGHAKAYPGFVLVLVIIKIVAGGKRRAEITATQATHRAQTETLERNLVEARMQALQAQIEPHFLFNTLASIDQLIQTDPPRASRMQQSLIRYLRSAMPQMREGQRSTLGQQVELSRAFLDIMAVRMEARLAADIAVPEGLKSAVFPPMMLQTLVENSIKHGLEPKATGGKVEIAAEVADGLLAVQVLDTGVGFEPKGNGVGLANIRERLAGLYGERAELIITVPPGGGTCATIKVPYEVAPPA
jgi:LytS/YehU family sensor histidine kinase